MPYAAEGRISRAPIEGGIEITEQQYAEALAGMLAGLVVSTEGGFSVGPAPEPEPVIEPPPTPEDIQTTLTNALNRHLDSVAGQRRYDNRFTCALRAGFLGPFQDEGLAFAAFMDECNMTGYLILQSVKAGLEPVPTEAGLIARMPVMVWPPSPIPEGAV